MNMKPAITITTTILVSVLAVGLASAQSPSVIQNTRNTMNGVSNNATAASNEALGIQQPGIQQSGVHQPSPGRVHGMHSVAKSSGVAAVAPAKPGPKTAAGSKRSSGAPIRHVVQPKPEVVVSKSNAPAASGSETESEQQVVPDSKYNANGRRDPFLSPVVGHTGGSGCSTGKKCLEIGTISLRGVVHGESGFIAVVSNSLNKAYFLRENDPVFNGYVVRITGDSIVFQETLQDRLGKTFTREVVKKITTPAV
jgi:hypothetical protein